MFGLHFRVGALVSVAWLCASAMGHMEPFVQPSLLKVCQEISGAVSPASQVVQSPAIQYLQDISHWVSSSTQQAACSVEPGSPSDVSTILQIVGRTRTPFAVKGGGHATNPGFSSTTGVHISMSRFSEVSYDSDAQTATIGAGMIWDDVYTALSLYNVTVVGGRASGVGVAGYTLGGGYSWLSNQYGLTIDTVTAFELVLPDGTVTAVTEASDPPLFFSLKGGGNNFGIVTSFTLRTFPQTQVWGGLITITEQYIDQVTSATSKFCSSVTDPKAAIITSYNSVFGEAGISQLLFYDGPTPPEGIFDDFLAIPHFTKDISTRSMLSLIKASPTSLTYGDRGIFNSVPIAQYTPTLLNVILNETLFWGKQLSLSSNILLSYDVEPFLPSMLTHGSPSAYPATRENRYVPLNIFAAWLFEIEDSTFHKAVKASAANIRAQAEAEGQDIAAASVYSNYAMFDTPPEAIYGENLALLKTIKALVDLHNVMALAGGFRF